MWSKKRRKAYKLAVRQEHKRQGYKFGQGYAITPKGKFTKKGWFK